MRVTINLDDRLLNQAKDLTGIKERAALVHEGLRALIQRESAQRPWDFGVRLRFKVTVFKWRNSLAILIPVAMIEALKLRVGDEVELRIAGESTLAMNKKL